LVDNSIQEEHTSAEATGTDALGNVYWLKLPQDQTSDINQAELIAKLYDTVDKYHRSGKDVVFVPVDKGYHSEDELKRGFLKSLNISPLRKAVNKVRVNVL